MNDVFRRLIQRGRRPGAGGRMSCRRLRTLLRARGARDAARSVHGRGADRGAARRAAVLLASCSRPRCEDLRARRPRRERLARPAAASSRSSAPAAPSSRAPYRDARSELEAALVRGRDPRGAGDPAGPRARRSASARAAARRREVQVLYDGAETVLAGNAEAFLARARRRRAARELAVRDARRARRAASGGVEVVTHALFNPSSRRHAVHGRGHLRLRAVASSPC